MIDIANALKLLGDDTRLRILRLLAREPLNVSELTSILGLAQSGISRHLSLLRKAGLVDERKEGVWTYYRLPEPGLNGPGDALHTVWTFVREHLEQGTDPYSDLSRLTEVLRQRDNFGGGLSDRLLEPGQSWLAWSRALHFLMPPLDAIDLGCGDGTITVEISRFARQVVGIDANPRAVAAARKRAEREHRRNIVFREGRIEELTEPAGSFDLAVFSQSLHFMEEPMAGVRQAVRVLRPGARLLVVDLVPHGQEWVREKLGHRHLGFDPDHMAALLSKAGLKRVGLENVNQRRGETFRVFLATGTK
ncbi:MAG: metalloregulator ArsR/SmtB family transcription factor [Deltaproteobacteria bacterium]|nr:metalloregulator ArsR/SmtB family transcription factor [Deltaproteobacteria bacterium]